MPDKQELSSLGKIYQSYFSDPDAKAVIDAIVSGQPVRNVISGEPSVSGDGVSPDVTALKSEIIGLKNELRQYTTSSQSREET